MWIFILINTRIAVNTTFLVTSIMATKPIQMTIDELLLEQVDDVVRELGATRSSFIRDALQMALQRYHVEQLEQRQAAGYARHPLAPGEFDIWESEQVWGDA
jgi:Arc/MetJ-type ribon-helix-helix transcriptional regulator